MKAFEIADLAQLEAHDMLCGPLLGTGSARMVFRNRFDETKVVKIAINDFGVSQNIEEFHTWSSVEYVAKINSFFAQCYHVSTYGTVLVQEYIPDIPPGVYKLPSIFTDLKAENYGLVRGTKTNQVVCRDYGLHLMREQGMKFRMKNWTVV